MEFEQILNYSVALAANNERSWFHANHKQYEGAKAAFADLLECMRFAMIQAVPALESDLLYMPVKSWMYRTARDMRIDKRSAHVYQAIDIGRFDLAVAQRADGAVALVIRQKKHYIGSIYFFLRYTEQTGMEQLFSRGDGNGLQAGYR